MRGIEKKPAYGLILKIGEASYGEGFDKDVKKTCFFQSRFLYLVGRERFERSTNGLKVQIIKYK